MPAKNATKTPSYRLHRPTGQALVELSGKRIYLGKHGTPESLQRYAREIAAWKSNGRKLLVPADDLTIAELCSRFMDHAVGYYVKAGRPTSEVQNFRCAIRALVKLYADLSVEQFGVSELRVVRDCMIEFGWKRKTINSAIGRVRHMIRWSVGRGMTNPHVIQALECVEPLKRGRCQAKEAPPVKPVPDSVVDATLPFMSPTIRAMVELQRLTGMRSGEVIAMRGCDLDTSGDTWVYVPQEHKTEHHDCPRPIYLGKRLQYIVGPFLKADVSAYLFCPADAEAERVQQRHAARKTPLNCGNRPGSNKSECPERTPGDRYTSCSYGRAITRACVRAWPTPKGLSKEEAKKWRKEHHWHPHQLRHLAATRLRKQFGLEAARVTLGHKTTSMTELYAELDFAKAATIAAEVG